VLPAFNIWILEREIILLLPIFTIYINHTLKRWQFIKHHYGFGQILICILSIAIAVGVIWILRSAYHSTGITEVANYWNFVDTYKIYDPLIGIVVFIISYNLLRSLLLGHGSTLHLKRQLRTLQSEISATKNLSELNSIVQAGIDRIFKAKYSEIILTGRSKEDSELSNFFIKNRKEKIFLKDLIFMEEKKRYFNTKKLLAQLPPDAYLALPLFNFSPESTGIGFCILGVKPFGDAYTGDEIEALQEFAFALELHLRYIDTYGQLRELSIHLDQKVDEKTFEYNQLINRQKEFIHLISHEIKSPIANAIFQIDSILDDVADKSATIPSINHDLWLLNTSLIGVGELTNKLFSVEYFDIHSVSLFREKVQIGYMFQTEFEIASRLNPSIEFINQIDTSIGFVAVDRIQLQQVITNLLGNAIKFVKWTAKPAIAVQSYRDATLLHLIIEDNGPGFSESNPETFFEKYAVGQSDSVGLGMGLYLCKKIIEMHGGAINASNSSRMWGAKIHTQIPLQ
jgi:signal transduction histidine kinase